MQRHVYVAWEDNSFFRTTFFSQSSDDGDTFSTPVNISGPSSFGGTPLIAVDSAGGIDLAWEGCFQYCRIFFSRSSDAGNTFSPQVLVAGTLEAFVPFSMAVDSNDSINIAYNTVPNGNVYLARSTDQGAAFTRTNVSNNNSRPYISPNNAHIAIDSSGNIDIVWQGSGSIYFSRSTDQGTTFSSSNIMSSVPYNSGPQIALGSSGDINLVWTGGSSTTSDVFFSRSIDGGATFSTPQKLSNNTGFSPSIALDFCGNIDVAWVDSSPGNLDIFFRQGITASSLLNCAAQ
jgi:hypothetical protein